jgi:uncharacterized damage-inducible protein DinB
VNIVDWIVEHVEMTYRKGNWAGPGVLPALEGLTPDEASWRPNPEQKSASEMIRHMAFWKDAVTSRLTGGSWEYREDDNWRPVPATADALADALRELATSHDRLIAAVRGLTPERLHERAGRAWWREPVDPRAPFGGAYTDTVNPGQAIATVFDFAVGAAQHDMYHAAQIFVLRRGFKTRQM